MRDDMFKVIVERPRRGVGYYRTLRNEYRAAKHFKIDHDFMVDDEYCSSKQPMRSRHIGWDGKSFSENLNPLRRYLKRQVGRCWNDVYSDICKNLDTGSTVKQHVRDHLKDYVSTKTYRDEDGEVWSTDRRYRGVSRVFPGDFYVENGILCEVIADDSPKRSYRDVALAREWKTLRVINGVTYRKENDLWFRIEITQETQWVGGQKTSVNVERKWSLNKRDTRILKMYDSKYA